MVLRARIWFSLLTALTLAFGLGCSSDGTMNGADLGGGGSDLGNIDFGAPVDGGMSCSSGPVTTQVANPTPAGATDDHGEIFAGRCGAAVGQIFPPDAPWNQSVRTTCVDPRSPQIIAYLQAVVDGSQTFRIDMGVSGEVFGFNPLLADDSTAERAFTPTDDHFAIACDTASIPVPMDGRLEGELDYACSGGDCHLIVHDTDSCQLYEQWRSDDPLGTFEGGCLAIWDTTSVDDDLRGLSCTSADAAGLPIMPLLVTPSEVARGEIRHALRFILPNEAVQRRVFVRPSTHNPLTVARHGEPAAGPGGTMPPPYGVRLRLRADFDTSGLSPAARAMAEALKEYGMFHADGGSVTFIASNDHFSDDAWGDANIDLGPNDLRDSGMAWTDFEVVSDLDDVVSMSDQSCSRTVITD